MSLKRDYVLLDEYSNLVKVAQTEYLAMYRLECRNTKLQKGIKNVYINNKPKKVKVKPKLRELSCNSGLRFVK